MGKNDKEKQILYEWGKTQGSDYHFQEIDQKKESYFIRRGIEDSRNSYIREYRFETLPEFMKELDVLWQDEEVTESIKKAVGVATIKNRPVKIKRETVKKINEEEPQDKLPEFIYNF